MNETEKDFENEGAQAFVDGVDECDNPYDVFDTHETERAMLWQHGYRIAKSNDGAPSILCSASGIT